MKWRDPERWSNIAFGTQLLAAVTVLALTVAEQSWWASRAAVIGALLILCLQGLEKRLRRKQIKEEEALAKRLIKVLLQHVRNTFFLSLLSKGRITDLRKHRVTRFVYKEDPTRTPSKWLEIYARVGSFADSTCRWNVDDSVAEPNGFAGTIWYNTVSDLLEASHDWPLNDDPVAKLSYAQDVGLTVEQCKQLNVKSRYFAGAIVKAGHLDWGVLILDSTEAWWPSDQASQGKLKKTLERFAILIGASIAECK